jgi:hypothetical protein
LGKHKRIIQSEAGKGIAIHPFFLKVKETLFHLTHEQEKEFLVKSHTNYYIKNKK